MLNRKLHLCKPRYSYIPAQQSVAPVPQLEEIVQAAVLLLELKLEHTQAHQVPARRTHQPAAVEAVRVRQREARRLDQAARSRQVSATICTNEHGGGIEPAITDDSCHYLKCDATHQNIKIRKPEHKQLRSLNILN